MPGNRDEIASTQWLIDLGIVLLLVDFPVVVERVVIGRGAGGEPGTGARAGQVTRLDLGENAHEFKLSGRARHHCPEVTIRVLGTQVNRTAGCRSSRAIDIGGAEVDVDLINQLRIDLLV